MGWAEFIADYAHAGGHERSNAQSFTLRLLDLLGVPRPTVAQNDHTLNDYVFERRVKGWADHHARWVDFYKRGCVLMELKQSRLPGRPGADAASVETTIKPSAGSWDAMMRKARLQAMSYVAALPATHDTPVFTIICDIGCVLEVWADFSGTGRGYAPFPDRLGYRIRHSDLIRPEIQARLRAIFLDPWSLDPAGQSQAVTRAVADKLALIERRLSKNEGDAFAVAHFLARCIFTLFAADVGLLPKTKLLAMLEDCEAAPASFAPMMTALWSCLGAPEPKNRFFTGFGETVRYFGGSLFDCPLAFALEAAEIRLLIQAARSCWRSVDPAIFGSLLEKSMSGANRRRMGAHFTPRAYVERLVEQTVIAPLREDWRGVQANIECAQTDGKPAIAVQHARDFLARLGKVRVLDPACGTGNFLYIAMEMLIRLQGEVLDLLVELGETDVLDLSGVGPHQFKGIDSNPRAVRLASIVMAIGFLQQHYRNQTGHPAEPILTAFEGIEWRDALLHWRNGPKLQYEWRDGALEPAWPDLKKADWPEADFIVGNPPFIGGATIRTQLDPGYVDALRRCYPNMNPSADLVMYWWDKAAEALTRPGAQLRRFGFVTTNSITQVFQRRVIERWMRGPRPLSLIYAIPDHPWLFEGQKPAAVRIAMTVAAAGSQPGVRAVYQDGLSPRRAAPALSETRGRINADLSIGVDVTLARALAANADLCSPGFKLHGAGFVVSRADFPRLGLDRRHGLAAHIRPYRTGRDMVGQNRDAWVLDFHGLTAEAVRDRFPEAYQHLVEQVKEARDADGRPIGRDVNRRDAYRDAWWVFGEPRASFRPALKDLRRYIVTCETAKHRIFQFLDAEVAPDNTLVCIADDDASTLAVLSSRVHAAWCVAAGGLLEDRPRYTKSRCFDPFPFPELNPDQRVRLAEAGEALDRHRRAVLRDNPDLTLTELYNVLAAVRSDVRLSDRDEMIKRQGLVVVLRQRHELIDRLTADAYGWPADASDADMVERLTGLNSARAAEEADGRVRWLRPDYQATGPAPRLERKTLPLPFGTTDEGSSPSLRVFPRDTYEQPLALRAALREAGAPIAALDLARRFDGGRYRMKRINRVLATLHRYGHVDRLEDGRWRAV